MAVIGDENVQSRARLSLAVEPRMVIKRRRFKQTQTLEECLVEEAKRLRDQARSLPCGRLRDELERRIGQFEAAYEVTELVFSLKDRATRESLLFRRSRR